LKKSKPFPLAFLSMLASYLSTRNRKSMRSSLARKTKALSNIFSLPSIIHVYYTFFRKATNAVQAKVSASVHGQPESGVTVCVPSSRDLCAVFNFIFPWIIAVLVAGREITTVWTLDACSRTSRPWQIDE
jgi:hypothetical protein